MINQILTFLEELAIIIFEFLKDLPPFLVNYLKEVPRYFYTSLFLMFVIVLFSYFIGKKVSKLNVREKPNYILTIVISFIEVFNNFVKENVGKQWRYVAPLTFTLALYVFLSNVSGVIALDSPTKYTTITFSLSITAFIIVQSTGIVSQGWRHFLGIFQPLAAMAPLNIISEFTPIISMSLRLFGNIASGALILSLVYSFTSWGSIVIAPAFHLIFDIGFGLIQTLVIVLLTIIFASLKVSDADLEIN
jgi:F-type H+-transporting ATPase subunit a